ncbi:hypothetical protein BTR14_22240 [Rhizobium rhizosphaerae]|uniref:Fatty acid desaturase domain-containing protein n=1 Tax=Xaviernesmea rhizosphaerae TaxID=1672749 RepID=A0ABX3P895_9HYPH|nr:hypothetical protein BTR14_22240 [Xaviernesmea rhizosphaerae]
MGSVDADTCCLFPAAIINFHSQPPEHFDCDVSATDAPAKSRTVRAGRFAAWFVNNDNLHTSHHWMPNVPIGRLPHVEAEIGDLVVEKSTSYRASYKE